MVRKNKKLSRKKLKFGNIDDIIDDKLFEQIYYQEPYDLSDVSFYETPIKRRKKTIRNSYEKNKDSIHRYYLKNKEKLKEKAKEYRKKSKEKCRERKRE